MTMKESVTTQQELKLNTARSRVTELTSMHEYLEKENTQLRKDKSLLVDHVADIQKKVSFVWKKSKSKPDVMKVL